MSSSKVATFAVSLVAFACAAVPDATPRIGIDGDSGARIAVGSESPRGLPREVDVAGERVFPLAIELDGRTLRGVLGVGYEPRAELAMTLDAALLEPAMRDDLALVGWTMDFSRAIDLVYLAASDVDANALLAHDFAQRYTGPVPGKNLGFLFVAGLLTVGQGVPAQGSPIPARHLAEATWIEDGARLRGMRVGARCLFVRPNGGRDWIGPLFARGAEGTSEAPRFDAELADFLPRAEPPSYAVGDGVHGLIAAKLSAEATTTGLQRLRVDVRGTDRIDAAIVVAAESAPVGELSDPRARVVDAGDGRHVVVWSVPLAELARGPRDLSYRCLLAESESP